jgi:hypothetical protein
MNASAYSSKGYFGVIANPHPQPFSLMEKGAKALLKVPRPEGEGFRVRVITQIHDRISVNYQVETAAQR